MVRYADPGFMCNTAFVRMWGLPEDMLSSMTREQLHALQAVQVKNPDALLSHLSIEDSVEDDFSVVELRDGRIFERHARPQVVAGRSIGRVVNYRDITQRVQFEATDRAAIRQAATLFALDLLQPERDALRPSEDIALPAP